MLIAKRPVSVTRTSAAGALAVTLAACATQVEPPVVVTRATQSTATAASVSHIELRGDGARLTRGAEGAFRLEAPEVLLRVEDPTQWRGTGTALQTNKSAENMTFAGGVRIAFDDMSISASRAQVTMEPGGGQVWTLSHAMIVRESDAE